MFHDPIFFPGALSIFVSKKRLLEDSKSKKKLFRKIVFNNIFEILSSFSVLLKGAAIYATVQFLQGATAWRSHLGEEHKYWQMVIELTVALFANLVIYEL